jgi:hypothetical protein
MWQENRKQNWITVNERKCTEYMEGTYEMTGLWTVNHVVLGECEVGWEILGAICEAVEMVVRRSGGWRSDVGWRRMSHQLA